MFVGANYTIDPTFSAQRLSSADTKGALSVSEATKASAEEAWIHGPLQSTADLIHSANLGGYDEGAELTQGDINARKESEFYAQYINIGEDTITEREYKTLYAAKRAQHLRASVLSRAPDTFTQAAKNFGVMLSVGMVDPLNIALGYLPISLARAGYLGAKSASLAKNYAQSVEGMSALGRAGARASAGGATGLAESGVTEVPVYFAAKLRGEDYDAGDVLTSIMFGSVVGAGIHVGGGALYDVATLPSKKRRRANSVYKKQIARENMQKIRDIESSVESRSRNFEVTQLLKRAYINADQHSVNQRFLARINAADREALMQTSLASYLDGNNINVKPLLGLLESKNWAQRYQPEDVDLVYRDVIAESLESELDLKSVSRIGPAQKNEFARQANELRNKIDRLEKDLRVKPKKGTTKKVRAEFAQKQTRLDALNEKLNTTRSTFKVREGFAKKVRDRVKQIREGRLPKDVADKVNQEVARRMEVIDATNLPMDSAKLPAASKLNAAIRVGLRALKQHAQSPTTPRTFRPEAEPQARLEGVRVERVKSMTDVAQQAVDAEASAKMLAEQVGIDYKTSADFEVIAKQIKDTKLATEALGVCMGKVA